MLYNYVCYNICTARTVAMRLIQSNNRSSPVYFQKSFVGLYAYVIECVAGLPTHQFMLQPDKNSCCLVTEGEIPAI